MLPLDKDLQLKKLSLQQFIDLTVRVLSYLPNIITGFEKKGNYMLYFSTIAGTKKYVRPINSSLFINEPRAFINAMQSFNDIVLKIRNNHTVFSHDEEILLDSVLYTIQQSIGSGLDLLVDPNSARKHVGNRFEELMKVIFTEIGVPNKRLVLKIPYETEEGVKNYICENDLILSSKPEVIASKSIDDNEIIVSVKTTSKDRMGKMFIDKVLLERFVGHPLKMIGIFLNDVQRKENNNISYTLVSGLFMVYNKFLTQMHGVYYLDPPPNALISPYKAHIKPFSKLLTQDIRKLLPS